MIAAIAHAHGASIATWDSDLDDCGVPVINPWGREWLTSDCQSLSRHLWLEPPHRTISQWAIEHIGF